MYKGGGIRYFKKIVDKDKVCFYLLPFTIKTLHFSVCLYNYTFVVVHYIKFIIFGKMQIIFVVVDNIAATNYASRFHR